MGNGSLPTATYYTDLVIKEPKKKKRAHRKQVLSTFYTNLINSLKKKKKNLLIEKNFLGKCLIKTAIHK